LQVLSYQGVELPIQSHKDMDILPEEPERVATLARTQYIMAKGAEDLLTPAGDVAVHVHPP
jgi:hypothetical protein